MPPLSERQLCALSIDMDPLDHYLHARGYEPLATTNLNAVYDDALPRFLDLFDQYGVRATFFVVGKDALAPQNRRRLREVAERGHEVANHTYSHHQTFRALSAADKRHEIVEADKILSDCVGRRLEGFRAPGWGVDLTTLEILEDLRYTYDSSVLPSRALSWIAAANHVLNRGRLAKSLHSSLGRAPKVPYRPAREALWRRGDMRLLELPPTVLPLVQFPFLGTLLYMLGKRPFALSLWYLRWFSQPLLYELHGIEQVDYHTEVRDPRLAVKPGLKKPLAEKTELYRFMLSSFSARHDFVTMQELAGRYA